MASTRSTYWRAMSWNGLVAPQDDCNFRIAVWARETFGMATAAAPPAPTPAAAVRNLRRDAVFFASVSVVTFASQVESLPATLAGDQPDP